MKGTRCLLLQAPSGPRVALWHSTGKEDLQAMWPLREPWKSLCGPYPCSAVMAVTQQLLCVRHDGCLKTESNQTDLEVGAVEELRIQGHD